MKFAAKYKELIVCVKPGFRSAVNGVEYNDPGVYCQFHDHMYETQDQSIIDLLLRHPEFSRNGMFSEQFPFCVSGGKAAEKATPVASFDCVKCDFKAKDEDGLTLHSLTHRKGRKAKLSMVPVGEGV